MTAEEFVIWLKGFAEASNEYNVTPKQWQSVKDMLDKVKTEEYIVNEYGEQISVSDANLYDLNEDYWYINTTTGSWEVKYYNHT